MRRIILSTATAAILSASVVGLMQAQHAVAQPDNQTAIADQRTPIALDENESAFIRREMRGLLESIRDIVEASATGDRVRVAVAARRAGMNGPEATHIPKSLAAKLPGDFKKLGLATHRGFDQIALDAERNGSAGVTSKQLVELMGNCLGCHATWRLVGESKR
jgi:hypothetical protein